MIKKEEVGIGFKFLASVLCLLVAVALTCIIGLMSVRQVLTKDGLRTLLYSDDNFEAEFDSFGYEVADYMKKEWGLNKGEIDQTAEDFWAEVIVDIAEYAVSGEGEPIDVDHAIKTLQKYEKDIEAASGVEISSADYDELRVSLRLVSDQIKDSVDFGNMENEVKVLRDIRNAKYLVLPIGVAVLGTIFIIMIYSDFLGKALAKVGISGLLSSAMCGLLFLLCKALETGLNGEDRFIETLFFILKKGIGIGAIIVLVAGIALIVIGSKIQASEE